jgi:hypothetical protein
MSRPCSRAGYFPAPCSHDEQLLIEILSCSTFRVNYLLRQSWRTLGIVELLQSAERTKA